MNCSFSKTWRSTGREGARLRLRLGLRLRLRLGLRRGSYFLILIVIEILILIGEDWGASGEVRVCVGAAQPFFQPGHSQHLRKFLRPGDGASGNVTRCAVSYFVHLIYLERWPRWPYAILLATLASALPMGKDLRIPPATSPTC